MATCKCQGSSACAPTSGEGEVGGGEGRGGFRSQRLNGATAGRHPDPSSPGHGKIDRSEGDTGFQEAKTATSGPCSAPRTTPPCPSPLAPEAQVYSPGMGFPGMGFPGARPARSQGAPAGEGALGWTASTRLGTRQWAPAEQLSR